MAALNMPASTFLASTTVTVVAHGDARKSEATGPAITSGAASAAGACTLSHANLLADVPYVARGLGPDGVMKKVVAFAA